MSVGARIVTGMTAAFIARQEGLGTRFDAIKQTEREIAAACARRAAQVDDARRFSEVTAASQGAPGGRWSPGMVAEREFVSELAVTLRLPQRTAENLIEASRALAEDLPGTRAALAAGEISYRHAQILIDQAGSIPDTAKPGFEAALLRSAGHLTVAKLKYKARLLRERLHPETIQARHTVSVADRKVGWEAEADGMASLWLYDTAEKVNAAYHRVSVTAGSLQGPTEPRTLTQLRADVLADLLLDGVTPAGLGTGIRATVNVTVPVLTLLGQTEEPGHLEGYGPIDPRGAKRRARRQPWPGSLGHCHASRALLEGEPNHWQPRSHSRDCRIPGCRLSRSCAPRPWLQPTGRPVRSRPLAGLAIRRPHRPR